MDNEYIENRSDLKRLVGKNVTLIGTLEGKRECSTKGTKKEITRYLLRRVEIKGQNIKLDHIWIPGAIVEHRKNEMIFGSVLEVTGQIQHYSRVIHLQEVSTPVIRYSYKIENLKKVTVIKKGRL